MGGVWGGGTLTLSERARLWLRQLWDRLTR